MASGRFASGYHSFEECVQLAQQHGLSKVEAAYLGMQGNTYLYLMRPLQPGIDMCLRAAALARRLGHPRAEIVARHAAGQGYLELDDVAKAMAEAQVSLELARAIRSPRFEGESIAFIGWCVGRQGDRKGASKLFAEALELMRGSMGYCGPLLLGALAMCADDEADRERFLQEGERLLGLGSIAFNAFYFNRSAMELMLDAHQYERALRYTRSMEEAFGAEPVPLVQFVADRARALVAFGRGSRDVGLALELERLRNDALTVGMHVPLEGIDRALATMRTAYTQRTGAENTEDAETTGKQSY
jgi:tetratricopeptide (TPR) repeat protein